MKTLTVLILFFALANIAAAASWRCKFQSEFNNEHVKTDIARSAIAFSAEVIAAEPQHTNALFPAIAESILSGYDQTLTLRIAQVWKGEYQVNGTMKITLRVTDVCGGVNCTLPYDVGDNILILSPYLTSRESEVTGCVTYEGVRIEGELIMPVLPSERD